MKAKAAVLILLVSLISCRFSNAAVLFVDATCTNGVAPFTNWDTAAGDIQSAVDAASPGDLVLVTNGVYQTGGRSTPWDIFPQFFESQVAIDKPLTVQSVNGPAFTAIYGQPYFYSFWPARRCVSLVDGATLSGFTLTYATAQVVYGTEDGGAAYCVTTNSVITNCIISGTTASGSGGGISGGTVVDSTINYNSSGGPGGGAANAILIRCLIGTNSAGGSGGGAASCTLANCSLAGNVADTGGAAGQSTLDGCVLAQNFANVSGGAVAQCTLSGCALFNNSSAGAGGAAVQSALGHCTLVYNAATNAAGGALDCTLTNCISYYNAAPTNANYSGGALEACCSLPLPPGTNNISAPPVLADNFHLAASSPCLGAGEPDFTFGTDIDGEAWANPPAIGCDEVVSPVVGVLNLQIQADVTNVFAGAVVNFTAQINGHASSNAWDFGDGTVAANQTVVAHSWAAAGDYPVELRAFNDSFTNGVAATLLIHVGALTNYVSLAGTNPVSPYLTWATAATNIQDAIDVSPRGATVLVADGVYATSGRTWGSGLTNRIVVTEQVTVRSVNGPAATAIVGFQVPGTVCDFGAVRCARLLAGASLAGFTLTNGATEPSDDGIFDDSGGGINADGTATVSNCVIVGNAAAATGGGLGGGTALQCHFEGNSAGYGGAAGNATLANCKLLKNSAGYGGGVTFSTLANCVLSGNRASSFGGAWGATLNNCTLTANSSDNDAGGADGCTLDNCILWGNTSLSGPANGNYAGSTLNFCCTAPVPYSGAGNFSADPQLADAWHLAAGSPCTGAGSTNYVSGADIDGEPWRNPPSVGADEHYAGAAAGALAVSLAGDRTNTSAGFPVNFMAAVSGHAVSNRWDFGDGMVAENILAASHNWALPGDYTVTVTAFNDDFPGGVSATNTVHVFAQPVHYVSPESANPVAPYLTWDTAATNIQDAVDAATMPGALIIVSNGTYAAGGRVVDGSLSNRLAVTKPVVVQSLNGPGSTFIVGCQDTNSVVGDDAIRCVYLTNDAALIGFTLSQGATRADGDGVREQSGGGVFCASAGAWVSNCIVTGCVAQNNGGGVFGGTIRSCVVSSNTAYGSGGGAESAVVENSILSHNTANGSGGGLHNGLARNCSIIFNHAPWVWGGGVNSCTLRNCVVYYNGDNDFSAVDANYCCLPIAPDDTPDDGDSGGTNGDDIAGLDTGTNNVTSDPHFVDATNGDFRLLPDSPCINAGKNIFAPAGPDFAGDPRIIGDAVDIGAYEFQTVVPFGVALAADATNAVAGFPLNFVGSTVGGPATTSAFDFGDGTGTNNVPALPHVWAVPGDYTVTYTAYNENHPAGLTAALVVRIVTGSTHYVSLDSTNPVAPYLTWDTAATNIQDAVDAAYIGGTVIVSNGVYTVGGRPANGPLTNRVAVTRPMNLQSVNGPAVTAIVGWLGPSNDLTSVRCVYATNGVGLAGFTLTNGATLAGTGNWHLNSGGGLLCESAGVIVSNCVIVGCNATDTGGGICNGILLGCTLAGNFAPNGGGAANAALTNCVLTGNASGFGGGAQWCVLDHCGISNNVAFGGSGNIYISDGTGCGGGAFGGQLSFCTLANNRSDYGGGVFGYYWMWWYPTTLNNCRVTGNTATAGGGGVKDCVLNSCLLAGNSAASGGGAEGGSWGGALNGCTFVGNVAGIGGGVNGGSLYNSIAYYNTATNSGDNWNGSGFDHSDTAPLPDGSGHSITNAPQFADMAGGDFHLQSNSPCINSGNNSFATGALDADGLARISGGTVDIGAYELPSPASRISYAWLQQYGLATDGSADNADPDGDGLNNWQEWVAGTGPTDAVSVLKMLAPVSAGQPGGVTVSWQSVADVNYFLERSSDLSGQPAFSVLQNNLAGNAGTTSYTDFTATNATPYFYRVGVQPP